MFIIRARKYRVPKGISADTLLYSLYQLFECYLVNNVTRHYILAGVLLEVAQLGCEKYTPNLKDDDSARHASPLYLSDPSTKE